MAVNEVFDGITRNIVMTKNNPRKSMKGQLTGHIIRNKIDKNMMLVFFFVFINLLVNIFTFVFV